MRAVVLGTSGVCNSACLICPRRLGIPPDGKPMDWDLYRKIIDGVAKVGAERVGFGLFDEPLLDPLIVERLKYCREKGIHHTILSTNGLLLTQDVARKLYPYVKVFLISLHALDPDIYKRIMPPLDLDKVVRNIEELAKHRHPDNEIHISVVKTRLNRGEFDKIRERFSPLGVVVEKTRFSNRAGLIDDVYDDLVDDPVERGSCNGSETARDLIVDWDGTVLLCCQDFAREYVIGDFKTQSLDEILNDPRRKRAEHLMNSGLHSEIPTCRKCRWTILS